LPFVIHSYVFEDSLLFIFIYFSPNFIYFSLVFGFVVFNLLFSIIDCMVVYVFFRGFCYFNSVAIAAKQMREKLKMKRILILDWVCITCSLFIKYWEF